MQHFLDPRLRPRGLVEDDKSAVRVGLVDLNQMCVIFTEGKKF